MLHPLPPLNLHKYSRMARANGEGSESESSWSRIGRWVMMFRWGQEWAKACRLHATRAGRRLVIQLKWPSSRPRAKGVPGNLGALCSQVLLEGMLYSPRPSPQQLNHLPISGLGAWTAKPGASVELQPRLLFFSLLLAFPGPHFFFPSLL